MTALPALQKYALLASLGAALLAMAGCQTPTAPTTSDFHPLAGGTLDNTGAVIEEPGVFRIVGGQNFTTPFAIDCTQLSATPEGYQAALAAGAHKVLITLPGVTGTYGGVLALCAIHKSATGPASLSYDLVIPDGKLSDAQNGGVANVAQEVDVNRPAPVAPSNPNATAAATAGAVLAQQPDVTQPSSVVSAATAALLGQQAAAAPAAPPITEDFAWMLWFSDAPQVFGINFAPPTPPPTAAPAVAYVPIPTPNKGQTYTAAVLANLRSGAGASNPIIGMLSPGDAVVATGDEKSGFWAVTTVAGQSGWVWARSLNLGK